MTALRPEPVALAGAHVRLEPLGSAPDHVDGLVAALVHPEVFAGGFGGGPAGCPATGEARAWAWAFGTGPDARRLVVRLVGGEHDGLVVGGTTLGDLDEAAGTAHVGWTGYDPRVWGTAVNPECKLLVLAHAFAHGYARVRIQADAANARSRAAIERLGAELEAVRVGVRVRADGTVADTAVYWVTADRWPHVRAGLEARLAAVPGPVVLRPWPAGVVDVDGRPVG
jgi:RimJ/RimL family protein N-acetyltransferase